MAAMVKQKKSIVTVYDTLVATSVSLNEQGDIVIAIDNSKTGTPVDLSRLETAINNVNKNLIDFSKSLGTPEMIRDQKLSVSDSIKYIGRAMVIKRTKELNDKIFEKKKQ